MKSEVLKKLNSVVVHYGKAPRETVFLENVIDFSEVNIFEFLEGYLGELNFQIFYAFRKHVEGLETLISEVERSINTYNDLVEYLLLLDCAFRRVEIDDEYFHEMTLMGEYAQIHEFKVALNEFNNEVFRLFDEIRNTDDDEQMTKSKAKLAMAEKLREMISETQKLIKFKFALLKVKKVLRNNPFLTFSVN